MADLKRTLFGYSSASVRLLLTERDAALDRASKNASAAEQVAKRLALELSETRGRLAGLEEQLETAEKHRATLTTDLERAVAQRESVEAEVLPLRRELEEVHTELRDAKEAIVGQEEQLRAAQAGSATLEELLRQQAEHLEQATAEAAESRERLLALEESGGFEAASAQQARLTELEVLVEGYRQLIEGGSAESPLLEPSDALETPAGPSTASELAAVIEVAEQAVASIMESTRVRADQELRAVDGEREMIRRDVETMTAWRDRAAPMIASLQAAMHEIQSQGAEIGRRVLEALRPVSTAVTALNSQLESLDDIARGPLVVSTEAADPSEADEVMELPEEHPAGRDTSDR
jgi:predicted  nucleic acid-binding Zn-ribbon protein